MSCAAGWALAASAGKRRGIDLGPAPLPWLIAIAGCGSLVASAELFRGLAIVGIGVAALVDARCGFIFDPLTLSAVVVTLGAAAFEGRAPEALSGSVAAGIVMLVIRALAGSRGLGMADVKLGALVGEGLGPVHGVTALGLAFVLGAGVAVGLVVFGRLQRGAQVRFGPYLLAGSLCDLAYHRLTTGVLP